MTSSTRQRGFTLLELIVAAVLMVLLLGMMFNFLIPTMRASAKGSARVEMQQQAVVALGKIADDVERSAPAGVSINTAGVYLGSGNQTSSVCLAVQRLSDVSSGGTQSWDLHITAYCWNGLTTTPSPLVRKIFNSPLPDGTSLSQTSPSKLSDSTLNTLLSNTGTYSNDTLATGVLQMQVTSNGIGALLSNPVTVRLVLGRNAATGANTYAQTGTAFTQYQELFDLQRTVAMRNSN